MTAQVHELPTETDRDAEFALLAATCHAGVDLDQALQTVTPQDFTVGRHRTCWEAFQAIRAGGQPLEPATVLDWCEHKGVQVPNDWLADLFTAAPIGTDVLWHADRVHSRAVKRRTLTAARRVVADLEQPGADVQTVVHQGASTLLDAVRGEGSKGLVRVRDNLEELHKIHQDGVFEGYRCGWGPLDALYRPDKQQITVVTGIPSHGKSTWLDAYLLRMAHRHDWRIAFFTPERVPTKHQARMIATAKKAPYNRLDAEALEKGAAWLDEHFVWIDDSYAASVQGILAAARHEHDLRPLDGLVVDPWNWVEVRKPADMKLTEFIGEALNEFTRFAQRHSLHVWVVAHPTKVRKHERGERQGAYQVPTPYDISESANWFNKPWWCLAVWRDHLMPSEGEPKYDPDRDPRVTEIHVQKVRDDDLGRVGRACLLFDPRTRAYDVPERQAL